MQTKSYVGLLKQNTEAVEAFSTDQFWSLDHSTCKIPTIISILIINYAKF